MSQSRRSISVRGDTYTKLRKYCDSHHESASNVVENLLCEFFSGSNNINMIKKNKLPEDILRKAANCFTF